MTTYEPFSKYEIDVPDGAVFDRIDDGDAVFDRDDWMECMLIPIPPDIAEHVTGCELRRCLPANKGGGMQVTGPVKRWFFVLSTAVEVES